MKPDLLDEAVLDRKIKGVVRLAAFGFLVFGLTPFFAVSRLMFWLDPYRMPRVLYLNVCRLLGMRVRVHGRIARHGPVLFMANHTSYLDVPALGSVVPAFFVAKSDVAHWPVFGPLTRLYRTVFVERKATRAAAQRDVIRPMLERGTSLVIFPEGTSSDGQRVLPFKSSLFGLAEGLLPSGGEVRVQPVSIVCTRMGGLPVNQGDRAFYAWFGDMDFLPHLWRAFQQAHFTVDIIFHPPTSIAAHGNDRKELAKACQAAVAHGVEQALRSAFDKRPAKQVS
jgi:1-acyl-sn-glycerol-3-phosphate acyltransferase